MKDRVNRILSGIINTQRVANGYLFFGGKAEDRLSAALLFAKQLNCESPSPPCGSCPSCKKIEKNLSPDLLLIEKSGASLKIDQIRQLKENIKYGPTHSKWKAVVIKDADAMTLEASNSFLKSLEEPPLGVVFILLAERSRTLPQTILSRCQKIIFSEPSDFSLGPEMEELCKKLSKKPFDFIDLTDILLDHPDPEELLSSVFIFFARQRMVAQARYALSSLRALKLRANKKLVMDNLGMDLWTEN